MSNHRHRPVPAKQRTLPFTGVVYGTRTDVRAHGNVCVHDVCRCGALRDTNVNQGFEERGAWRVPREHGGT
jgi:hypothetical protein